MSRSIENNTNLQRFEWAEDGILSVLDYQLQDGVMVITHTGVPEAVGGRGIAADLTKYALDTARENGWTVRPQCSYAAAYIKRHPEYADLAV
ncbi:GNAT family N-acetyltransferase [Pollutimonas nitritireducens]|uniref:GNAT family N-acetyltransferase n=1 Tax=Pollutimonas nitritireducens TaxID=2045209 RepID=A0A2N4UJI8_9BURK|nr:GNAT family N-acetyltransferase [Pollutimonas nitritireducens]PLC55194.1 GNAT family N-acetyltransferase [Pollutimonas nitritireducens]